jgi:hypothetical protein
VTHVGVCILGQRIHFWCYFYDLTNKIQNGRQNDPFLIKIRSKWKILNMQFEQELKMA